MKVDSLSLRGCVVMGAWEEGSFGCTIDYSS